MTSDTEIDPDDPNTDANTGTDIGTAPAGPDPDDLDLGGVVARSRAGTSFSLTDHDPRETFGWDKEAAKVRVESEIAAVAELQTLLFAEGQHALLVVLQAMDAAGKDGILRTVLTGLNPAGVHVRSFGVPSEEDLAHDFLWRIHRHTPAKGQIGVFNRSHYEDVLVARVKGLVPREVWKKRYDHIAAFERTLVDEGTAVVKLYLNVSNEKQRERLQDRVDSPDERWKFRRGDLEDRKLWPDYMSAYTEAIRRTDGDHAPWYIVPADRKWVRNLVVARILRHELEQLDPKLPPPEPGIAGTTVE